MTAKPRPLLPLLKQVHVPAQSLGFSPSHLLDRNVFEKGTVMVTDKEALVSSHRSTYSGDNSARSSRTGANKPIPSFKQGQRYCSQVDNDHQNTPSPSRAIGRIRKRGEVSVCSEQRHPGSNVTSTPSQVSSFPALKSTTGGVPQQTVRKRRAKHTMWPVTQVPVFGGIGGQTASETNAEMNSIDVRSIYGKRSKILYVKGGLPRQDTVVLWPLTLSRRREQVGADDSVLPRKRPELKDAAAGLPPKRTGDSVTSLKARMASVSGKRHCEARATQSLLDAGGFWQGHPPTVSSSLSLQHGLTTAHYCDVLGRRFCHRCTQWAARAKAQFVGRSVGPIMPAALARSPTICSVADRELSFVGVKKVIITKAVKTT